MVYTPEQGGICERANQTILNGNRTILTDSGLPPNFWPEAVKYFCYLWNRVCHRGQKKIPFQLYLNQTPSVRHLHAFGLVTYIGIPKPKQISKLHSRSVKSFLVRYALKTKGYRVWVPKDDKKIETI